MDLSELTFAKIPYIRQKKASFAHIKKQRIRRLMENTLVIFKPSLGTGIFLNDLMSLRLFWWCLVHCDAPPPITFKAKSDLSLWFSFPHSLFSLVQVFGY